MEDLRGLLNNSIIYTRGVSTRQMYLAIGVAAVLSVVVSVVAMRFMFPGGESRPLPVAVAVSPTAIPVTRTAIPTATPLPTSTVSPTSTPVPTKTPTAMPSPTKRPVVAAPQIISVATKVPTTGTVQVVARLDGKPFPGVKLETHSGRSGYTKDNGSVTFSNLPVGTVGLKIMPPASMAGQLRDGGSDALSWKGDVKAGGITYYTYNFYRR